MSEMMQDSTTHDAAMPDDKLLVLPLGDDSKKITQVLSNNTARSILNIIVDTPLSASDIATNLNSPLTTIKYNLDMLLDAGFINIHSKKWSRKGREVKLYSPSERVILFVPNTIDKVSVMAVLKKYMGVIGAAVFASAGIEALLSRAGFQAARMPEQMIPAAEPMLEFAKEKSMGIGADVDSGIVAIVEENTTRVIEVMEEAAVVERESVAEAVSGAIADSSNISPAAAPVYPIPTQEMAQGAGLPPDVAHITPPPSELFGLDIMAHPGLWFLLGCLFIIALVVVREYVGKKRR
ncbi:MAG: winged helix-turn-helix transcriptional regulator [Methanosarcinales archaeon]|nr:winged helix-turn-helix transcriptional regulator [Methanosarcinales archaeon]